MAENMFQQMLNEQRTLEAKIGELENSINVFQETLGSYMAGLGVLEELKTRQPGETMLINIGGAIFIEAQVVNNERVIRGIGSGIRTEQSLEDAQKIVSERVTELNKFLGNLRQEYEETTNRAAILANQAQQILAQAQMTQAQAAQQTKPEE
ncbi:MAG: prefoldin subunit alpha [Candidatus Thorarchaeota archaeon]|nr:prefoldin subunit alpha [Candidatus Thorarchaeota archaeon]